MSATRHIVALALGPALGGCPVDHTPISSHCSNARGDADCIEKYGASRSFCARGPCSPAKDGCVATRPEDDACYSPCGAGTSLDDNPSCIGAADGTSSSSTSAGPSSETTASDTGTTTDAPCVDSTDCTDPAAPICDDMRCTACTTAAVPDDACALRSPDTPLCRDDGACVACTPADTAACEGLTPICNAGTNTCQPCSFHAECPDSACKVATGECFSDACIRHVDANGGEEFVSIQDAIASGCVVIVHDALGGYPENLSIDVPLTTAILAADGASPLVTGSAAENALLDVVGGATLYVEGLRFAGTSPDGIGITASASEIYLDRVQISNNQGAGLSLANSAKAHLRNCFIGNNGNGAETSRGLHVIGSTLELLYTTVAGNDAATDDSLVCSVSSSVSARNSILLGRDGDSVDCSQFTATYSVFDQVVGGEGNEDVGAIDDGWFSDIDAGNLHLTAAGVLRFLDIARWEVGDPPRDIDGNPRPVEPGSTDVAGADRP